MRTAVPAAADDPCGETDRRVVEARCERVRSSPLNRATDRPDGGADARTAQRTAHSQVLSSSARARDRRCERCVPAWTASRRSHNREDSARRHQTNPRGRHHAPLGRSTAGSASRSERRVGITVSQNDGNRTRSFPPFMNEVNLQAIHFSAEVREPVELIPAPANRTGSSNSRRARAEIFRRRRGTIGSDQRTRCSRSRKKKGRPRLGQSTVAAVPLGWEYWRSIEPRCSLPGVTTNEYRVPQRCAVAGTVRQRRHSDERFAWSRSMRSQETVGISRSPSL